MNKLIVTLLAALTMTVALQAQTPGEAKPQTPEEIMERMEVAMERGETEGMSMNMAIKIPIIGSMTSRVMMIGEKTRMDMSVLGKKVTIFTEGDTSWTYTPSGNTVTIESVKDDAGASQAGESMQMMEGVSEGYDVTIEKEDDEIWGLLFTKQKSNKDKDAPKKIYMSIYKGSYMLKEFSTSMKGIKMTMKDVSIGVKESDVTFNADNYPGAKIVDKRK